MVSDVKGSRFGAHNLLKEGTAAQHRLSKASNYLHLFRLCSALITRLLVKKLKNHRSEWPSYIDFWNPNLSTMYTTHYGYRNRNGTVMSHSESYLLILLPYLSIWLIPQSLWVIMSHCAAAWLIFGALWLMRSHNLFIDVLDCSIWLMRSHMSHN